MARHDIAAVLSAFLACAIPLAQADGSEPVAVEIRLRVDPSISATRLIPVLQREAEAIWEPYGVRLEWLDSDPTRAATERLVLEASIDREPELRRRPQTPAVLGRVTLNHDQRAPGPIHMSFDAIESALALRARGAGVIVGIVRDRELARGLGRVLAHEVGHVLIGLGAHAHAGLMRPAFVASELGQPERSSFRLTCRGVEQLRGRLGGLTAEARRESPAAQLPGDVVIVSARRASGAPCIS